MLPALLNNCAAAARNLIAGFVYWIDFYCMGCAPGSGAWNKRATHERSLADRFIGDADGVGLAKNEISDVVG